jgi:hypothetical protein
LASSAAVELPIDADLAGAANRLAHCGYHFDVALGFDADLDFDGRDPLGRLARSGVRIHDADAVRQRSVLANLAAEELIDRNTIDLPDGIVQGDVDRSLRVGIAAQHTVHARVHLLDLGDVMHRLPGAITYED